MSAADESYARLVAAQRFTLEHIPTIEEREEARKVNAQSELRTRIRRKLPRVY